MVVFFNAKLFSLLTEEILDQLESDISELELDISHPSDPSDMEETLDNPSPIEMEGAGAAGGRREGGSGAGGEGESGVHIIQDMG